MMIVNNKVSFGTIKFATNVHMVKMASLNPKKRVMDVPQLGHFI